MPQQNCCVAGCQFPVQFAGKPKSPVMCAACAFWAVYCAPTVSPVPLLKSMAGDDPNLYFIDARHGVYLSPMVVIRYEDGRSLTTGRLRCLGVEHKMVSGLRVSPVLLEPV